MFLYFPSWSDGMICEGLKTLMWLWFPHFSEALCFKFCLESRISSMKSYTNKIDKKLGFKVGKGDLRFLIFQLSPPQGSNETSS